MPKRIRHRLMYMTEPAGSEPVGGGTTATATQDPPGDPGGAASGTDGKSTDDALGESGIKALRAERDARTKAEKDLADLQKTIDDSKKSAEEKASDALQAAQSAAGESALKALKYEVAAEKELPLKFAARLQGTTKEELAADADALKEFLPTAKSGPKPDPSQGKSGTPALPDSQPGVPRLAAAFEQAISTRAS